MKRRGMSLVVALLLVVTGVVRVEALELNEPGVVDSLVELTAAAATFSVTVPTNLTIHVDAKGVVTTADNVKIENLGHGPVKVTNVVVESISGWTIESYQTDMSKEKVGTQKLGFKINGCETGVAGLQFEISKFPGMDGKNPSGSNELGITYDAIIPAQKTEIVGSTIATIVFTIGWDE